LGAPQPQRADPPPSQRVSGGRRRFERLRLIADATVPKTRICDLVIEAYYAQFVPRGDGDASIVGQAVHHGTVRLSCRQLASRTSVKLRDCLEQKSPLFRACNKTLTGCESLLFVAPFE
jgi:hypothetical protein